METVFFTCVIVGGTLMLCQFVMGLLGLGGHHEVGSHDLDDGGGHDFHTEAHHDAAHDHHGHAGHGSLFFSVLTFRTVVAAITFFGLAGMAATANNLPATTSLPVAIAAGLGAMFLVAYLMRTLSRLRAEGTVRIDRAVGQIGTVYLRVPGNKAGAGKVHLNVQNRTVECQAVTAHDELATGAKVVVVAIVSSDTVEVAPATAS